MTEHSENSFGISGILYYCLLKMIQPKKLLKITFRGLVAYKLLAYIKTVYIICWYPIQKLETEVLISPNVQQNHTLFHLFGPWTLVKGGSDTFFPKNFTEFCRILRHLFYRTPINGFFWLFYKIRLFKICKSSKGNIRERVEIETLPETAALAKLSFKMEIFLTMFHNV